MSLKPEARLLTGETVLLSLGSNLGSPRAQLQDSLRRLAAFDRIRLTRISSLYMTEPVSDIEQPWYLNCAAELLTDLTPDELLDVCQSIERDMGRTRTVRWEARTLDLDIIYFGSRIVETDRLTIPHPRVAERKFVLVPLNEISPAFLDPISRLSIQKMMRRVQDKHAIVPYEQNWFDMSA